MGVVDRFIDAFNAGDFETMRSLMADGYSHAEPLYPGPYDADEHTKLMREVLERTPDRRVAVVKRLAGVAATVVELVWTGTMPGGDAMRIDGIYVFDLAPEADLILRSRAFYGAP
jgi:hypothetical protein